MQKDESMAVKDVIFDIRSKPSGRVNGVLKDKEENLNRFSYSKDFEIDSPSTVTSDVYRIELNVPQEFTEIEGVLYVLLDGSKLHESKVNELKPGINVLDINNVITKGHKLSAVLEYSNAKSLGHYTLQLKLDDRQVHY